MVAASGGLICSIKLRHLLQIWGYVFVYVYVYVLVYFSVSIPVIFLRQYSNLWPLMCIPHILFILLLLKEKITRPKPYTWPYGMKLTVSILFPRRRIFTYTNRTML
jgi:hypothetical protein